MFTVVEVFPTQPLDSPLVSAAYDGALIDSPPSVGRLTTNALVAASHVLVITEPTSPSLAGVVNRLFKFRRGVGS